MALILKICDFGLAKPFIPQEKQTPGTVTASYRAPEIIFGGVHYDMKIDMWAIGCILYELAFKVPFIDPHYDNTQDIATLVLTKTPCINKTTDLNLINSWNRSGGGEVKLDRIPIQYNLDTKSLNGYNMAQIKWFDSIEGGSYGQFLDLLGKLLVLDPTQRWTATQALDHPFFSDFKLKNFIAQVRHLYPPRADPDLPITIYKSEERICAVEQLMQLYNTHQNFSWYQHKMLFLSLDLFDRYLEYNQKNPGKQFGPLTFLSRAQETKLRNCVCLYMAIKYYSSMQQPLSWRRLVTEKYYTPEAMKNAEAFEIYMIQEVCQGHIYRKTIYDYVRSKVPLDVNQTGQLFYTYGHGPSSNNANFREIARYAGIFLP